MTLSKDPTKIRPPSNALRVKSWQDLPTNGAPARYKITANDGSAHVIKIANGTRIILDALLNQPVYCASPVRISDRVYILRHQYCVPIAKEMFENDTATDRAKFGVYFLNAKVERVSSDGGAV